MTILQKKSSRRDGFFQTNLDFINHPLQDFWNFPPTFPKYFQIFSQISIFGEFRYLCLKFGTFSINNHGEKYFQSYTLFGSFFNFAIVQCEATNITTRYIVKCGLQISLIWIGGKNIRSPNFSKGTKETGKFSEGLSSFIGYLIQEHKMVTCLSGQCTL